MEIKEAYHDFTEWLNTQSKTDIAGLMVTKDKWRSVRHRTKEHENLVEWYEWYQTLTEDRKALPYLLGDRDLTLKDLSTYMLDKLSVFGDEIELAKDNWIYNHGSPTNQNEVGLTFGEAFTEAMREDGYGGTVEYNQAKEFWETLDGDKLMSLISGSVIDQYDVDIDGGRHCWVYGDTMLWVMIMCHIKYCKAPISKETLEVSLYNSNELYDALISFHPPESEFMFPTEEQIGEMLAVYEEKESSISKYKFNTLLEEIVRQFDGQAKFQEKVDIVKGLTFK